MDPVDLMDASEEDVNMLDDDNSGGDTGVSANQERRIRREIANSNERRRMQSINAGFQSLRTLLPYHEGEKLSKAAILQQTAEYIYTLEQEKTRLLQQNSQLKRLLALSQQRLDGDDTSPQLKKKRIQPENESNERPSEEDSFLPVQVTDLNLKLIQEQRLRLGLEERLRLMETQLGAKPLASMLPGQTIIKHIKEEEPCRIVVTEDFSSRPPATILLSAVPEAAVNIVEESPAVRLAVERLPSLTAPPPPQPPPFVPVIAAAAPVPQNLATNTVVMEQSLQQELTDSSLSGRSYILTTTSRQNLDSIVEAIRHLEGDHLFSEDQQVCKEEVVEYQTETLQPFPVTDQTTTTSSIFIINKN